MIINIEKGIFLIQSLKIVYDTYRHYNNNRKCLDCNQSYLIDFVENIVKQQSSFFEDVKKLNIKYKVLKNKEFNNNKHCDSNRFYKIIELDVNNIIDLYCLKTNKHNETLLTEFDLNILYRLLNQVLCIKINNEYVFIRPDIHYVNLKELIVEDSENKECNICLSSFIFKNKSSRVISCLKCSFDMCYDCGMKITKCPICYEVL